MGDLNSGDARSGDLRHGDPISGDLSSGDPSKVVVGVAGAGTMGAGIAQVAALAGHPVILYDVQDGFVQRGLGGLASAIRRLAEKGKLDGAAAEAAIGRVTGTTDTADFAPCALVIEAAPEDIDIKQSLFQAVEAVASPDAVLATNTSTLSVARIAAGLARPGRVCGMHFFNPAPLMPLVEVIRGPATEAAAAALVTTLAAAWGKTPVAAADRPGFIVNRVARPFYGEALRALGEGLADAASIDRLARDAGFPMGPFELMDLIGIDVNFAAASSVYEGFFQDPRFRPHPIQRMMVESGRLGRKTGQGYYRYDERGAVVATAAADSGAMGSGSGSGSKDDGSDGDGSTDGERAVGMAAGDAAADLRSIDNVLILAAPGQAEAAALADRLRAGGAAVAVAETDAHLELEARQADALIDLQPSWDAARAERLTRYGRWLRRGRPLLVNTETISATRVAAAIGGLGRPERLVGFTLLPPLDKRGCVELMAARQTDDAARPAAEALWRTAGLEAVWIGDTVGGILPRLVACLAAEAMTAVMDGTATAEGIDQAMRLGTRYPRGPLEWLEILGAGRVAAILDALASDQGEDRYRVPPLLRRRVEAGG